MSPVEIQSLFGISQVTFPKCENVTKKKIILACDRANIIFFNLIATFEKARSNQK